MTAFQGNPVKLAGKFPNLGDKAPVVEVVGKDLNAIKIGDSNKTQIVVVVPSLDTPVCAAQTRKFNEKAAALSNAEVIIVSMDLPFAMGRFCTTEGIENLSVGSDFRGAFGKEYGVLIDDSPLKGLLARAIFIIKDGKIAYTQLVPEITSEPDYEDALKAV